MRSDLRYIASLAIPVALAELGWMAMGVVDTVMVGWLGPTAIGAVSIGGAVFEVPAICGIGLLLGLDTVVSQSFGGGDVEACDKWVWQGLYLAAVIAPLLIALTFGGLDLLPLLGVQAAVVGPAQAYLNVLTWSIAPLLVYAAVRRYLQGMSCVRPVMFTLVSANLVNAVGNWLLIPRSGVAGAAWATFWARVYMAAMLIAFALVRDPSLARRLPRPDREALTRLLRLGAPAAGHILLEVGIFATTTILAGRLLPNILAAHHVVLTIAATTFMVPLGISSAGAVVVGQAIGAGEPARAKRSGWIAIALGAGVMALAALSMVVFSKPLLGVFTSNRDVLAVAGSLLYFAILFQIFDGTQVAATGALRGAGDTKTPMFANLVAHWLVALPVGYFLCFKIGWGIWGLWTGFCIGLMLVAVVLLRSWSRTRLSPR